MKILIAGTGKVGASVAQQLSAEGYELTLIDKNESVLENIIEQLDVMSYCGNCATQTALLSAGVEDADLLIASTGADEVNLLCCMMAQSLNPNIRTIARIRDPEYSEQVHILRDKLNLSLVVNPEQQAAREIERLLKYPGFLKRDSFAKGKVEIVELKIDSQSPMNGKPLMELGKITRAKVLVCAVLRTGQVVVPSGDFVLQENDRIFVTAPVDNLTALLSGLGIYSRKNKKILICGGGRISFYLATILNKQGYKLQLIEKDHDRCLLFSDAIPEMDVICGDATSQALLESEGLDSCDALVTMTGLDEQNIIISLYGNENKVPQVITKITHLQNSGIIDNLPLGSIISPYELCCDTIVSYVRAMKNKTGAARSVHFIADRQVQALEFRVEPSTLYVDTPLKDIKTKQDVLIASITHAGHSVVPAGDSKFRIGDSVIVVATGKDPIYQLNDIFE